MRHWSTRTEARFENVDEYLSGSRVNDKGPEEQARVGFGMGNTLLRGRPSRAEVVQEVVATFETLNRTMPPGRGQHVAWIACTT